ncbi:MAG: oxidoreductase [Cohaesibacter sp.]|nr:oxidoreductase [Cohaesibacter sp.]
MATQIISSLGVTDWTDHRLPDLFGKRYVITGGNSGVGFEAARLLGQKGADIILACRSVEKAKDAKKRLEAVSLGNVDIIRLDLSDLASVREAAYELRRSFNGLDGLINNAGIMQTPELKTKDGFELQFGTNHLGHFLLTHLLLDMVERRKGRIVVVASLIHKMGKLHFDDLMLTDGYSPTKAYAQSKLANLMFAFELDRRLQAAKSPAIAIACHPGYSATNLQFTGPKGLMNLLYKLTTNWTAQSSSKGALPSVLAAAGTEAKRGAYYGPTGFMDMRGPVSDAGVAPHALDEAAARRLWQESERLLGLD